MIQPNVSVEQITTSDGATIKFTRQNRADLVLFVHGTIGAQRIGGLRAYPNNQGGTRERPRP